MNEFLPHEVSRNIIPLVAIGGGLLVAMVAIVVGGIKTVFTVRAREASRREIAAYVAEGSISPEQAERLLAAGKNKDSCC